MGHMGGSFVGRWLAKRAEILTSDRWGPHTNTAIESWESRLGPLLICLYISREGRRALIRWAGEISSLPSQRYGLSNLHVPALLPLHRAGFGTQGALLPETGIPSEGSYGDIIRKLLPQ